MIYSWLYGTNTLLFSKYGSLLQQYQAMKEKHYISQRIVFYGHISWQFKQPKTVAIDYQTRVEHIVIVCIGIFPNVQWLVWSTSVKRQA